MPKKVIRRGTEIKFEDMTTDIRKAYGLDYQEMFTISKERNRFFVEGVQPLNKNLDVDDNYLEGGEPTLTPYEMRERMYNVVRFMKIQDYRDNPEYLLKKNDVIKIGRVKLRVKVFHSTRKSKFNKKKVERRKQRLANERDNVVRLYNSKYPENYD